MPHRNPSSTEQITASTGLLAICAAVTGVLAIAAGMIEQHAQLYIAEGAIVVLLIALVLREYSARLHVRRQTRALSQKVREIEDKNRLLNLTEARAAVGHWRLDLETNRVFWSHGTFAIHGLPVGKEPSLERAIEMYHPDDRAIVEEAIASARETGDPYTFRARLIRQDNVVRHTEASALIEFNAAHEPVAMIGVFRDRTEEEEMQRDLRAARDEANALAEAKSAFLAKMSHEIRTPMNGVLGFADLLLTTDLNQSQRRHADFIAESGRVLQTLLNDILDLSKLDAGKLEVELVNFDPSAVANDVVQLF
ncbi:MAG: histidine kinase dimerization/phospho-acceptor domain-containing protein [Pseudomonadota bacterium]